MGVSVPGVRGIGVFAWIRTPSHILSIALVTSTGSEDLLPSVLSSLISSAYSCLRGIFPPGPWNSSAGHRICDLPVPAESDLFQWELRDLHILHALGYVLNYSFFTKGKAASLKFNIIKRYFRLLFPIVFAVLLSYVVLRLGLYYNQAVAVITGSSFAAGFYTFAANLPYAIWEGVFGVLFFNQTLYDDPLWTVAMEFYGSVMVFILLVIFLKNPSYRFYVYAVLIAVFFVVKPLFLAFVLGMFLCDLNTQSKSTSANIRRLRSG